MAGLTNQQQAYFELVAYVFAAISLTQIPAAISGQLPVWVPVALMMCGGVSKAIMQFLGDSPPQQQQTLIDQFQAVTPVLQKFAALTPDQQKAVLSLLALEQPQQTKT